jgi:hypothetical protein
VTTDELDLFLAMPQSQWVERHILPRLDLEADPPDFVRSSSALAAEYVEASLVLWNRSGGRGDDARRAHTCLLIARALTDMQAEVLRNVEAKVASTLAENCPGRPGWN